MGRLQIVALLHSHSIKIRHGSIKMFAILCWLGPDSIDCFLLLSALNSLEKVADLSAIDDTTVAMICFALHNCMLSQSHPFYHHHSVSYAVFFCFCDMIVHVVKAEILLLDMEEHILTFLHTLSLFHVCISIYVH